MGKAWCNAAVAPGVSKEKREFFGFLALSFGDVDVDKDGFINLEEFDRLLEKVAAVPRRYGLAPVQIADPLTRQMGHTRSLISSTPRLDQLVVCLVLISSSSGPSSTLWPRWARCQLRMWACTTCRTTPRPSTWASLSVPSTSRVLTNDPLSTTSSSIASLRLMSNARAVSLRTSSTNF